MRGTKTLCVPVIALAGLVAALMLTTTASADPWTLNTLPQGYNFSEVPNDSGPNCFNVILIAGQVLRGDTCDPNFPAALDAFVDATICTVNLAAGQAAGVCAATPTTDAAPAPPAPPATTTATTATQTTTVTVTVIQTDPTVDARLTALEQRQAVDDARLAALEQHAGIIVPEQKNQTPFTDPA